MTHEKPQLLTPPSGNHNLQKAQQMLEELPVDLHSLLPRLFLLAKRAGAGPAAKLHVLRRSFLFGDGIVDSFGESGEEGEVHGAGDARSMSEVEGGEAGEDLLDGAVGR